VPFSEEIELPAFKQLRSEQIERHPAARMSTAPDQAWFLGWLARSLNAQRILEVGSFLGYTTTTFALAILDRQRSLGSKVWSLPPAPPLPLTDSATNDSTKSSTAAVIRPVATFCVVAIENDVASSEIAHQYWRRAEVEHVIDLRLGDAQETLLSLRSLQPRQYFDMVYIDADKQNYERYYEQCLELISSGGVIAIDNIFLNGKVLDAERERNQMQQQQQKQVTAAPPKKAKRKTAKTAAATATTASSDTTEQQSSQPSKSGATVINELTRKLMHDPRIDLTILPIGDGLALCRKKTMTTAAFTDKPIICTWG
jgi:predicted O-methyltransferase YrrM